MSSTCIISILRLQSIYVVSISPDITWNNPLAAIWSSSECNFGIICSCLPTLKGCVTRLCPRLLPSVSASNRQNDPESRRNSESAPEWQGSSANLKTLELLGSYEFEIRSHVHPCERRESWKELESLREPEGQWPAPIPEAFVLEGSDKLDFEAYVQTYDSIARLKLKDTKAYQPTGKPQENIQVESRPQGNLRRDRYSWPLARGNAEPQVEDMRIPYSKFRSWYPK